MMFKRPLLWILVLVILMWACSSVPDYDVIIRSGMIYDGSGSKSFVGDIAIKGDKIAEVGARINGKAKIEVKANDFAVAPGFINMLSWSTESLIEDGRSQGEIRQGVTLEVMGEGSSMGPLNDSMKEEMARDQVDIRYDVGWTTLGEYLEYLEKRGVACNIASFIGATTVRIHEIGYADRKPTQEELNRMCELVRSAMKEGAVGLASALIYAPGFYAGTDELIALAKAAAEYDGMYISHLRSEGNQFLEALEEFLTIVRKSGARGEVYHLKAAGQSNWSKMDDAIKIIEKAQAEGLAVTADMYNYTAGATGLDAAMPPWVQEGGNEAWFKRLRDPKIRERVIEEMTTPSDKWENLFLAAGTPDNVLLVGFKKEELRNLTGKTLGEVARIRGKSPAETAIELVLEDESRVETIYFLMSEENVKKQIALPWVSFCSDAASMAPEGVFLHSNPHPRAYGSFTRLLGKYVREEKVIALEEAVRKLTSLPAENLKIRNRGWLKPGYFADIVIFDPETIQDHATFEKPHQYATGMKHVFVNGVQVLRDGEHTGAKPGKVVRGPGWTGWEK